MRDAEPFSSTALRSGTSSTTAHITVKWAAQPSATLISDGDVCSVNASEFGNAAPLMAYSVHVVTVVPLLCEQLLSN